MTERERIEALARRCARANLTLREARDLFEALYRADAIMLADGNLSEAARRSGMAPAHWFRSRRQRENVRAGRDPKAPTGAKKGWYSTPLEPE